MTMNKILSVVVPAFNEEQNIFPLMEKMIPILQGLEMEWEVLFVDDGSTDRTKEAVLLEREKDERIKLITLSRNFGKEKAMTAGLDYADGDAVIIMDADLQHPVTIIPKFIEKWQEGYEVVYAVRRDRKQEVATLAALKYSFYHIYNRLSRVPIPIGAGDFRLLDRRVVDVLGLIRERERFMKGLYAWVGFRQTGLPYDVADRKLSTSNWGLLKLWNYAITGFTSFSSVPLIVWSYIGVATALLGFSYGAYIIVKTLIIGVEVPGFATLTTLLLFIGGLLLTSIGIIGEYLSRMYEELKARPLYVVQERWGAVPRQSQVCEACLGTGCKTQS